MQYKSIENVINIFFSYHVLFVIIPIYYFCKMCSVEFSLIIRKISSFAKPSTAQPFDSIRQLRKANETRKSSLRLNSLVMPHSQIKNVRKKCSPFVLALHVNPTYIEYWLPFPNTPTAWKKAFYDPEGIHESLNCRKYKTNKLSSQNNAAKTREHNFITFFLSLNIFSCIRILNYFLSSQSLQLQIIFYHLFIFYLIDSLSIDYYVNGRKEHRIV